MGKKRTREAASKRAGGDEDRMKDSDDEDFDIVNVEFEWFNFDGDVDFLGTKTLLRQLLDVDNTLVDLSGLADRILAQPTIGSTVKVDGKATDAYAMLTALNLRALEADAAVAGLTAYLAGRAASNPALAPIVPLLQGQAGAPASSDGPTIGLVLTERFINMPPQIAPPLYAMLIDELEAAVEDGEPYAFTHYLVLSKAYEEVASDLAGMVMDEDDEDDDDDDAAAADKTKNKRKKARTDGAAAGASTAPGTFYFHAEDEVLRRHAAVTGTFAYSKDGEAVADSKRAFQDMGVRSQGLLMLIEASKFPGAVQAVAEYIQSQ